MSYATESAVAAPKSVPGFTPSKSQAPRNRPRRPPSQTDMLNRYLKRMDPEIAASFSEAQREAIESMLGARGMKKHAVEIRRSIPFAKWRFYAVILMGKEQRSLHRLRGEGAISRPFNFLVYLCIVGLLGAIAMGMTITLGL